MELKLYVSFAIAALVHESHQDCEYEEVKSLEWPIYVFDASLLFASQRLPPVTESPTLHYKTHCSNVVFTMEEELKCVCQHTDLPHYLIVDKSNIAELPLGVLTQFSSVTKMYFNGNHIKTISPGAFNGLLKLEELYLQNNELTVLSIGVFNSLTNLKILDASFNNLE